MAERSFDRVAVINLARRTDRRDAFYDQIYRSTWPFAWPQLFKAIDGQRVVAPVGYAAGRNTWACLQSHRRVLEDAINDGVDSILIMEDDVVLCENFGEKAMKFMAEVPDDWEMILFGGNHHKSFPLPVSEGIWKPTCLDRLHCYALRWSGLVDLYQFWHGWHTGHCDVAITDWVGDRKAYCAEPFLAGQRAGVSDVERVTPFGPPGKVKENWWQRNLMSTIEGLMNPSPKS